MICIILRKISKELILYLRLGIFPVQLFACWLIQSVTLLYRECSGYSVNNLFPSRGTWLLLVNISSLKHPSLMEWIHWGTQSHGLLPTLSGDKWLQAFISHLLTWRLCIFRWFFLSTSPLCFMISLSSLSKEYVYSQRDVCDIVYDNFFLPSFSPSALLSSSCWLQSR